MRSPCSARLPLPGAALAGAASGSRPDPTVRAPLLAAVTACVAAACGGDRRPAEAAPLRGTMTGGDAVLLRVPRAGGRVTAVTYPALDSVVWRSGEAAPPLDRVLDFDPESGVLAAVDTGGSPVRVDLRLGTARRAGRGRLGALAARGATFYGVDSSGAVTRLAAAGEPWRVRLSPAPEALLPQRDGSVLAAGAHGGTGVLWVLRPPAAGAADSVRVPGGARAVRVAGGDRVYFAGGDELLAVQARTLAPAAPVALGAGLRAAAASPSGDRLYVLTARAGELLVVDRFAGAVRATVRLPGPARDVRVDPLGRYLLARPARGDSAWVVAAGTDRVLGAVPGSWRADLPAVLADGLVLTADGSDVALVDPETLRRRAAAAGGAADFWYPVRWSGFRGAARPERVARAAPAPTADSARADSAPPAAPALPAGDDSAAAEPSDTGPARGAALGGERGGQRGGEGAPARAQPTVPAPPAEPPATPPPGLVIARAAPEPGPVRFVSAGALVRGVALGNAGRSARAVAPVQDADRPPAPARAGRGFTVQFAAAPSERDARRVLGGLQAPAARLRVVPRTFDGRTVYRVVAGPYATRAEAARAGEAAAGKGNFWVYEGAP